MSAPTPKRRLRLVLDLQADDVDEVKHVLEHLVTELAIGDLAFDGSIERNVTSGGFASGWHLKLTFDPEMTHDRYEAELNDWLAADRAERAAAVEVAP